MVLFLMVYIVYLIYRSVESMHMLQQNLYNENNRYIKWINAHRSRVFCIYDFVPLLFAIFIYITTDQSMIDFTFIASLIIYMYCLYLEYKNNHENQNKIPLKSTSRIKRLFITIIILYAIPIFILFKTSSNIIIASLLIILALMMLFVYYIVYLASIIDTPINKLENFFYMCKARKKLSMLNNLQMVGITGSYGKTSSKNILNAMLSSKYVTRQSPYNYNTLKGLMITINNYLDKFDEIFIAEMGAYVCGEIKEICDFIHPKYGILTIIGEAHLESFKSRENIQKAKFELIESLPDDGLAVLNRDDPYQVNYILHNKVPIVWIGIENKDATFCASNIKYDYNGMQFDCFFDNNKIHLKTRLLGRHNIYNILAGVALSVNMKIPLNDIVDAVSILKPVPHRLELKKIGHFYQLDDAYNSNPVGALSALETIALMPGDKCVVTPGMIELGTIQDSKNYEFGKQISKVADYVILIGKKRTKCIYDALIEEHFNKENIFVLNRVVDAYRVVNSLIVENRKMYALFENDLPDIYTEGE